MNKTKIFIYWEQIGGCVLHRILLPYLEVAKLTDEFEFTFGYSKEAITFEDRLKEILVNDVIIYHRVLPDGLLESIKKAKPEMKFIIDIDDNWRLNDTHPAATIYRKEGASEKILKHIIAADLVTCTTKHLANKIRPFNKNVFIFNNALNREGQFVPTDIPSERLRFGLVGGASHFKDYELLDGVVNQLPKEVLDKIQFVLCGFDRGEFRVYDKDGNVKVVEMPYERNSWHTAEVMLTDNYRTITKGHKDFLLEHRYKVDYSTDEAYHRVWGKGALDYASLYNQIDVLMVPLLENDFTACKSELKMVEASVMGKPVIVSDVAPYNNSCAIGALDKGGKINPTGNCLLVNNRKGAKGWAKAICRMTTDNELRDLIKRNISKICDLPQYNLTEVAKKRLVFLQENLKHTK